MVSKRYIVIVAGVAVFVAGFGAAVLLRDNPSIQQTTTSTDQPSGSVTSDYSNHGLTKFPKEVLNRIDVVVLDLSNNNLTGALPAEIRHLSNLEELNVSNNKMTGIPAEIGQLTKLKILNYANNQITGLPLELGNLTQLEVLDLSGNPKVSQYDLGLIKSKLPNTEIKL